MLHKEEGIQKGAVFQIMEKEQLAEVLNALLISIRSGSETDQKRLAAELLKIRKEGHIEELVRFLEKEYGADERLYEELLKYLTEVSNDRLFVFEQVHRTLLHEIEKSENLFSILQLKQQYNNMAFRLNKRKSIAEEWEMNCFLSGEMKKFLGRTFEKIPLKERNKDYIIIAVTQLLGQNHAPTRLVLELCRIIEVYLNKKVLLLNVVLKTDNQILMEKGLKLDWILDFKYIEEAFGNFTYCYRDYVCHGYQIEIKRDNRYEMQMLADTINRLKPYFIWNFGGDLTYINAMKEFTTILYTGLNQGYQGVPAHIAVNYFPKSPVENKEERQFLQERDVVVKDIVINFSYNRSTGKIERSDYNIPKEAFCLAVVGNRLPDDCSEAFLCTMRQVLEQEPDCYLVFIGEEGEPFQAYVKERVGFPEQLRFLGFQKELCEVLRIMDLFVNPVRLGGGTGGILAMNEGKPVIALKSGDVASFVGERFVCESLDRYKELILRYKYDKEFYQSQSEAAQRRAEEKVTTDRDLANMIRDLIKTVEMADNADRKGQD